MTTLRFEKAEVHIVVQTAALKRRLEAAIESAIGEFATPPSYPVIRLRTFRRLETVDVVGHIIIVRVTESGLRRLPSLIDTIREKGALGVQLVWNGEFGEPTIFRILEAARSTKHRPPVVVSTRLEPALALRSLIATRSQA